MNLKCSFQINMECEEKMPDNSIEFEDNFKKQFKFYKANKKAKPSFLDVISVDVIKDDEVRIYRDFQFCSIIAVKNIRCNHISYETNIPCSKYTLKLNKKSLFYINRCSALRL